MNIWSVLGIDATADKAAITAAYRTKLSGANPEDSPEAFKQLRAAYEQAIALAKQAAAADGGGTGEGDRWLARVDEVYRDIRRRRDENQWRELMAEDFCARPANRVQARDRLLGYLAEHYRLPHRVWQVLEERLGLRNDAEELRELFPPAFIDNVVLPGIEYEDQIPFELLDGAYDAPYDDYLHSCFLCFRALSSGQAEEAGKELAQMEATGVQHPYTKLCRARLALMEEHPDTARECVDEVLQQLPDDIGALLIHAQLAAQKEDFATAEQDLRHVLEKSPKHAQAKFDLAGYLSRAGRRREAKTLYLELLRALPFNRAVQETLSQLNRELLPELEQCHAEHPEDAKATDELAWCYLQLHQHEKADETLALLPADLAGTADYENLASKIKLSLNDFDSALVHLQAWETTLRAQEPIDKVRLPESLQLQAHVYFLQGQTDRALTMLRQINEQWPADAESWKLRGQFLYKLSLYPEALEVMQQYRQLAPADPLGPFLCGEILFHMRHLQDSYNAFEETMEQIGARDATCVLYQCRLLMLANQWDQAKSLLDQLTGAGIKDPALDYCQAQMAMHEKRPEDALRHFLDLLPACRDANPPDFAGEVFFRLACLQYHDKDKQELLGLVEEGLKLEPESASLLDLKVDLLWDSDNIPAALETCRELCRLYPSHLSAFESLGRLLQFRRRDFAGAAEAYKTQLKNRETAAVHNLLGLCLQELEQFEEAEGHFLRALELEPDTAAFQGNLAELYMVWRRYEDAVRCFQLALEQELPRAQDRIQMRRRYSLLLRRIGQFENAVMVLDADVKQEYAYYNLFLQAETWAQAGQFDRAMQALKRWRELAQPDEEEYAQQEARILRQMGRTKAALRRLRLNAATSRDCCSALCDVYIELGRYKDAIGLLTRLSQDKPDSDALLKDLALCQLWSGDAASAAETAAKGLGKLEANRSRYNKAMFYTRQAALLVFRGEYEKAAQALDQAEASPLCGQCAYCTCKDALAIRVLLLEQTGQLEQAEALCRESMQRFPDETDFALYHAHIRKRMEHKP